MIGCGIEATIAEQVGVYCRLMLITSWLFLLDIHVETLFINLGYAKLTTINSFVTGFGVDITCSYLFIYRLNMGLKGAALTQIAVKSSRVLMWVIMWVCNVSKKQNFRRKNGKRGSFAREMMNKEESLLNIKEMQDVCAIVFAAASRRDIGCMS